MKRMRFKFLAIVLVMSRVLSAAPPVEQAIEGVQPAALDQPRIYINFRRAAKSPPLTSKPDSKKKSDLLGGDLDAGPQSGAEAFLDTGASGVVLSADTVQQLGIAVAKARDGQRVKFSDTGIGGAEAFDVTEPLFVALASYPKSDPENPASYAAPVGPIRAQVRGKGGILELLAPGMDVAGMPVMIGKVIVIDPSPLAKFDKLHTSLVSAGDKQIPRTSHHVPLTYVSFACFTKLTPPDAAAPTESANPMIGPDPLARATTRDARRKPVEITHHGRTVTGTFLLDTGAAASIISTKLAEQLGVRFKAGTKPAFTLAIGGLGGQKDASGIFFDRLALPTIEGPPIAYAKAPLLINDISVADEKGNTFTLDGVIGMNYLVASAEITGGLLPDVGKLVEGPFRWIVIDHARGQLGLEFR